LLGVMMYLGTPNIIKMGLDYGSSPKASLILS